MTPFIRLRISIVNKFPPLLQGGLFLCRTIFMVAEFIDLLISIKLYRAANAWFRLQSYSPLVSWNSGTERCAKRKTSSSRSRTMKFAHKSITSSQDTLVFSNSHEDSKSTKSSRFKESCKHNSRRKMASVTVLSCTHRPEFLDVSLFVQIV